MQVISLAQSPLYGWVCSYSAFDSVGRIELENLSHGGLIVFYLLKKQCKKKEDESELYIDRASKMYSVFSISMEIDDIFFCWYLLFIL